MGVTYINPYRFAAFSPLDLSPALWLDAADTSTITSSGSPAKVSQWTDKSGNARNVAQATAANQPTTGSTTLNGRNVIAFDGSDYLGPSSAGVSPANGVTIFVVCRNTFDNPLGNIQALSQQDSGGLGRAIMAKDYSLNPNGGAYNTFLGGAQTSVGGNTFNWVIMSIDCAGGTNQTLTIQQNSTSATATRTMEATTGGYVIGTNKTLLTSVGWTGEIAEVIVYGSQLSADNRDRVRLFLNAKWAVY